MDATIKGKIEFYNKQNQMLAGSAKDAVNYYNTIIQSKFNNKFWTDAGLAGGASALLINGAISPTVSTSALPAFIATTTPALPAVSSAAGTLAIPATTSTALATTVNAGGIIIDGAFAGGDILAAGVAETIPGITVSGAGTAGAGTAATGAAAAGGGGAVAAALPYVLAGIALYFGAKAIAEYFTEKALAEQGKQQLESLSNDVRTLKIYCNIMRSQIKSALSNVKSASDSISKAEKKIVNQQYKTQASNLKKIRERQAEVSSIYNSLKATNEILDCVYKNLSTIA